jgi:SAM-dependent methyltransferase
MNAIDEREVFRLITDLHLEGERQGPGSDDATRKALELTGLGARENLRIADLGCGTGAATLLLARLPGARVTAVDRMPEFIDALRRRAVEAGCADRIEARVASMDALEFEPRSFDLIWSEGAIYNIGFAQGVHDWRQFLKPGGMLAVSELTWTSAKRPDAIEQHWNEEYPGIATAAEKIGMLEAAGYSPVGYFVLPPECWREHYYRPLVERLPGFVDRHDHSAAAFEIAEAERHELELYERYAAFYGYGFYIARRVDA